MKNLIVECIYVKYAFVVFMLLSAKQLLFATEPSLKNPLSITNSFSMPGHLEFLEYWGRYYHESLAPIYATLKPNIHPDISACLYTVSKIDRYGNPKIYARCRGAEVYNSRTYPPLYPGDVFPVLDQLYYFESQRKAIRVLEVKEYEGIFRFDRILSTQEDHIILPDVLPRPYRSYHWGAPKTFTKVLDITKYNGFHSDNGSILNSQIIIPLTPLDVFADYMNPFQPNVVCGSSGLTNDSMGMISFVQIRDMTKWDLPDTAIIYTDYNGSGDINLERMMQLTDSFQTKKEYKVGDILINHYRSPNQKTSDRSLPLVVGFRITKIVPPDPERNRVFQTVEGEKTGRLIGWVELDPTSIPVDENGNPTE